MSDLFANFKGMNAMEERRIGRGQGEEIKLIKQVCGKIAKGWSAEKIADLFDEDLEHVENICDIAAKFAPDYDPDKIYDELQARLYTNLL